MKIYADDGIEFKSVDECNAYEADLKLKELKKQKADKLIRDMNTLLVFVSGKATEYMDLTGNGLNLKYKVDKTGLCDISISAHDNRSISYKFGGYKSENLSKTLERELQKMMSEKYKTR